MPESFEGQDLSGSVFWGVDLSGSNFRDVNLTGTRFKNVWLVNADIDGLVERLTINGVDVTSFVNEHDPWYHVRAGLRAPDPAGMRDEWNALEAAWAATIERAQRLPEDKLHASVNGEWSFVQTLRHLVFAMDKWFTAPILGEQLHAIGLPNTGSDALDWPGRDRAAKPTFGEALELRADRAARFRDYLATLTEAGLADAVDVVEHGTV